MRPTVLLIRLGPRQEGTFPVSCDGRIVRRVRQLRRGLRRAGLDLLGIELPVQAPARGWAASVTSGTRAISSWMRSNYPLATWSARYGFEIHGAGGSTCGMSPLKATSSPRLMALVMTRSELDAIYLPPAAQGDVDRASLRKPVATSIIDGYFERVPSV